MTLSYNGCFVLILIDCVSFVPILRFASLKLTPIPCNSIFCYILICIQDAFSSGYNSIPGCTHGNLLY